MKQWTQHEPRASQLLDADQFNAEQLTHRGSIASLDRSQMPAIASEAQLVAGALHKTWVVTLAEQVQQRDTNVSNDQWLCATSDSYSSERIVCLEATLTGHTGGMTYIEWSGMGFCNAFAAQSQTPTTTGAGETPMEKQLKLKLFVAGQVVAESPGLQQGVESFRIFGTVLLPPGDHRVEAVFTGPNAGEDEPLFTYATSPILRIMLYHVVNSQLFAMARFR
tara:strand:+ start:3406 stop:4071 length:666 start_codon:yes stop_codon:yes gene_type:complete